MVRPGRRCCEKFAPARCPRPGPCPPGRHDRFRVCVVPGNHPRQGRHSSPQSWADGRASIEPRGVQQCGSRSARRGRQTRRMAPRRRFWLRIRQHRRRALDVTGAARTLYVRREQDQPAGGWRSDVEAAEEIYERSSTRSKDHGTSSSTRTCRSAPRAGCRCSTISRSTPNTASPCALSRISLSPVNGLAELPTGDRLCGQASSCLLDSTPSVRPLRARR